MKLILQRAVEEDAQRIVNARDQSFYDDYIRFGECPGYHNTQEEMKHTIRKADVYLILVDGKMVGDVSVHHPSEEGSDGSDVWRSFRNIRTGESVPKPSAPSLNVTCKRKNGSWKHRYKTRETAISMKRRVFTEPKRRSIPIC